MPIPKLEDTEKRIKTQLEMRKQKANQINAVSGNIEGRIRSLEQKIDKLMTHLGVR